MASKNPKSLKVPEEFPRTETEVYILLSLAPGSRYGYAIMKYVLSLSDGRIALSTGTLYGALKRLLEQGWIERRVDKNPHPESGRIRKEYSLTTAGKRILQAEVGLLQSLVRTISRQKAGAKG